MRTVLVLCCAALCAPAESQTQSGAPDASFFQHCVFISIDIQEGTKPAPLMIDRIPTLWRETGFTAEGVKVADACRSLAEELGLRKIRVNAVNSGLVETEGTHTQGIADSELRKQVEAQTPLGSIGQRGDIPLGGFLASRDADWIAVETLFIGRGVR